MRMMERMRRLLSLPAAVKLPKKYFRQHRRRRFRSIKISHWRRCWPHWKWGPKSPPNCIRPWHRLSPLYGNLIKNIREGTEEPAAMEPATKVAATIEDAATMENTATKGDRCKL